MKKLTTAKPWQYDQHCVQKKKTGLNKWVVSLTNWNAEQTHMLVSYKAMSTGQMDNYEQV